MKKTLILLALALCSSLAAAQTYKCVSNGKTSYQATPCETGKDVQASTLKSASGNWQDSGNLRCDSPKDVMSISFHDMPLRNVLQLIADFSGQKLVADTSISGNAAFQYQNRPWCEILTDVSRRYQLDVRAEGGMLYVKRR